MEEDRDNLKSEKYNPNLEGYVKCYLCGRLYEENSTTHPCKKRIRTKGRGIKGSVTERNRKQDIWI